MSAIAAVLLNLALNSLINSSEMRSTRNLGVGAQSAAMEKLLGIN